MNLKVGYFIKNSVGSEKGRAFTVDVHYDFDFDFDSFIFNFRLTHLLISADGKTFSIVTEYYFVIDKSL